MASQPARTVDWDGHFRRWRGSGLTQDEYCRRHRLSIHSFRRKLYRPSTDPNAVGAARSVAPTGPPSPITGEGAPEFLPVRVVGVDRPPPHRVAPPSPGQPIEVILDGRRRIVVPQGFDAETLLRVVAILEPRRC